MEKFAAATGNDTMFGEDDINFDLQLEKFGVDTNILKEPAVQRIFREKHGDGFITVTKQRFKTPAPDNLFVVNEDCDKLSEAVSADFHTIVAKTLYVTKRARPDTCLAIAFLTTRVRAPDTDDWEKLCHLMEYLRGDRDRPLVLGANNNGLLMWYVDAWMHCIQTCAGIQVVD
jgi:hypothetical protein